MRCTWFMEDDLAMDDSVEGLGSVLTELLGGACTAMMFAIFSILASSAFSTAPVTDPKKAWSR